MTMIQVLELASSRPPNFDVAPLQCGIQNHDGNEKNSAQISTGLYIFDLQAFRDKTLHSKWMVDPRYVHETGSRLDHENSANPKQALPEETVVEIRKKVYNGAMQIMQELRRQVNNASWEPHIVWLEDWGAPKWQLQSQYPCGGGQCFPPMGWLGTICQSL